MKTKTKFLLMCCAVLFVTVMGYKAKAQVRATISFGVPVYPDNGYPYPPAPVYQAAPVYYPAPAPVYYQNSNAHGYYGYSHDRRDIHNDHRDVRNNSWNGRNNQGHNNHQNGWNGNMGGRR